jgi:hypothetical protein
LRDLLQGSNYLLCFRAAAALPEHKALICQLQNISTRKAVSLAVLLDRRIGFVGLLI